MSTARLLLPGDPLPVPGSSSSITLGPGTTQAARRHDTASASTSSSSTDPVPLMISNKMGLLGMSADRRKKKRKVEVGESSEEKKGEAVQLWVDGRSKRVSAAFV